MTRADELRALAERCEGAGANEQERFLTEAVEMVHGPLGCGQPRNLGLLWIGHCAYLDAAMSLVPEGCGMMLLDFAGRCGAEAQVGTKRVQAATPALALAAASLRAIAAKEGE